MGKKIIAIIAVLFLVLILAIPAFASFKKGDVDSHFPNATFTIWTDEKYGVEYIVCDTSNGVGICPRVNGKGNIIHSPVKE